MVFIALKIKRQDDPEGLPYWELFEVEAVAGMTVATALRAIEERPVAADGSPTSPVAWECSCLEGQCGACAMAIGGKAALACLTPVAGLPSPIVVEPLAKFPIVRDLKVDRGRMFDALAASGAWVEAGSIPGDGPRLTISPELSAEIEPFTGCVMCGVCSDACPQVNGRTQFTGAFIFSLTLPLISHPIGGMGRGRMLDGLMNRGGLPDCAGAGACAPACPKGIPLPESASRLAWLATGHAIKRLLRG